MTEPIDEETRSYLESKPVPYVGDAIKRAGLDNYWMNELRPLWELDADSTYVGPATTMRLVPTVRNEEYIESPENVGEIVDDAPEGSFIVIESNGPGGVMGENIGKSAVRSEVSGIICTNHIRDYDGVKEEGVPYWMPGGWDSIVPYAYPHHQMCVEQDGIVAVNGSRVKPGDVIMGDNNGTIVIPREDLEEVVHQCKEYIDPIEERHKRWIDEGRTWEEIYEVSHTERYLPDDWDEDDEVEG